MRPARSWRDRDGLRQVLIRDEALHGGSASALAPLDHGN
jgi:hypothetical protein